MADTEFYEKMLADLPSQFKNKEKIEGLIYALSRQLNAVRDVYKQLNDVRSLRTATGKQLDGIGNIAVLTRDEATVLALKSSSFTKMTDDIYRLYLVQKIMANMTNCTYQDIYNAMVILWGKTPIWYSESIDEPATITMTVPALSSFDETSTFLGLWEIRPAGVQLHFAATANEKITINADFRPSAFIITHIKTGTKPRWAVVLTFDGVVIDELLSPKVFKERHEQTSENLHSGTKPTRIIFLDKDGVVINMKTSGSAFTQLFDRAGTKPRDAVIIGTEGIRIDEHGQTSRFIIEPPQTSEELHNGTKPTRMPKGNNNYGKDSTEGALPQRAQGTYFDSNGRILRTATGSGPASWYHDNTAAGIADLNGNVWEWNGGLRLVDGEIQIIPNNDAADWNNPLTPTSTLWRAIKPDGTLVAPGTAGTLKYGTAWNNTKFSSIVTTPAATGAGITLLESLGLIPHADATSADYGDDAVWANITDERLPLRGGYWYYAASAGVFALYLGYARSAVGANFGFRAAFCSL